MVGRSPAARGEGDVEVVEARDFGGPGLDVGDAELGFALGASGRGDVASQRGAMEETAAFGQRQFQGIGLVPCPEVDHLRREVDCAAVMIDVVVDAEIGGAEVNFRDAEEARFAPDAEERGVGVPAHVVEH